MTEEKSGKGTTIGTFTAKVVFIRNYQPIKGDGFGTIGLLLEESTGHFWYGLPGSKEECQEKMKGIRAKDLVEVTTEENKGYVNVKNITKTVQESLKSEVKTAMEVSLNEESTDKLIAVLQRDIQKLKEMAEKVYPTTVTQEGTDIETITPHEPRTAIVIEGMKRIRETKEGRVNWTTE